MGRVTYRAYGEQSGAERAADGKQYRGTVTERSAGSGQARTAGEGVEQRGARARTCSSLRGRKVLR